jgi:hypothetical protein
MDRAEIFNRELFGQESQTGHQDRLTDRQLQCDFDFDNIMYTCVKAQGTAAHISGTHSVSVAHSCVGSTVFGFQYHASKEGMCVFICRSVECKFV